MKILDVRWFNGCGIVRVDTALDGIRYFIKDIRPYGSETEQEDIQDIADWGSSFPKEAGDVLFGEKIAVTENEVDGG